MESSIYENYKRKYEEYIKLYDLPIFKTNFFQEDYHAMNYCEKREFVTLIIPFGDPEGANANKIFIQYSLVSYIKMYSDLIGGSINEAGEFLSSVLSVSREKTKIKNLRLEKVFPIAIIENEFEYNKKKLSHYGIVYVARVPINQVIQDKSLVLQSLNESIYFSNPHNQAIFELAKDYVEKYRINRSLNNEINYARKMKFDKIKEQKNQFLNERKIDISDYYNFKNRIVEDLKRLSPNYIIDIVCGDDDIIYQFLKIKDTVHVFANDIAFAYLENYHFKKPEYAKINFSNLNALQLPFYKKAFDIVFCKNLLHHLSKNDRIKLLKANLSLCKTMVIVEILSYEEQNENGKILHDYFYNEVLNETKGKIYLTDIDINELINNVRANVKMTEKVVTNNGTYRYVWLEEKTDT